MDLVGDRPIVFNETGGFLDRMTTRKATEPLRKIPLLGSASRLVAGPVREKVKGWILRSSYGKAIGRGFSPPR